jgi:hypothetical protein
MPPEDMLTIPPLTNVDEVFALQTGWPAIFVWFFVVWVGGVVYVPPVTRDPNVVVHTRVGIVVATDSAVERKARPSQTCTPSIRIVNRIEVALGVSVFVGVWRYSVMEELGAIFISWEPKSLTYDILDHLLARLDMLFQGRVFLFYRVTGDAERCW